MGLLTAQLAAVAGRPAQNQPAGAPPGTTGSAALPGAAGPRLVRVAPPPHDNELLDAFVYARPEEAAREAARPVRFPNGTSSLRFDLRLKDMPRTGVRIRYEVWTNAGMLGMADGLVSITRLTTEDAASVDFDLRPASGSFATGPHQLRLFMDERLVAVVNWSIGEF
jgi:hypothetical protein